jgi:hypothetical protein
MDCITSFTFICSTVDYLIMHSVGSQLGLCIIRSYALSDVSHLWLSVTSSCSLHLSYGFSVKIGSQFIYYIVIMLLEPSEAFVKLSRVNCLREAKLRCQKGLLNFCNCFCNWRTDKPSTSEWMAQADWQLHRHFGLLAHLFKLLYSQLLLVGLGIWAQ